MPTISNPLRACQEAAYAAFMNYGPPPEGGGIEVVESFGRFEVEYAAIRRFVGIMHMPQRGLVQLVGDDRADFLHRMLTQDINSMKPGQGRRSFLLNAKGRIDADMVVLQAEAQTLLDMDVFDTASTTQTLDGMLFTEDVTIKDVSADFEHIALHGPAAAQLLEKVAQPGDGEPAGNADMRPLDNCCVKFAGQDVTVYRDDDAGALALHLFVPVAVAVKMYEQLLAAAGFDADAEIDADYADQRRSGLRGRPIGWLAYNTARIEAGRPLYHIDYGPDSLPGETGVMDAAVSFTKGCYLGQEIVARMKNLGHPKRIVAGLKFVGDQLPAAGSPVHIPAEPGQAPNAGTVVGAVTSSTLSPLQGQSAIGLAIIKWGRHKADTQLMVPGETQMVGAQIHALGFMDVPA